MQSLLNLQTWISGHDWLPLYTVLVYASCLLSVGWIAVITHDPLSTGVPIWVLHSRRLGMILTTGGLLVSVLFGGSMHWSPWPPMILVVFGYNVSLAASLWAAHLRTKRFAEIVDLPKFKLRSSRVA